MIKRSRKKMIRFYSISDIAAIILGFHLTFWFRFYSGVIPSPKGIPDYRQYLIVIPFLVIVQLFYFSYQGYYRIKLRRNRLDDLFLVVVNSTVSAFIIILIFSYLKSYQFVHFEVSHLFAFIYVPLSVAFIFGFRILIFRIFKNIFLRRNGISRILIAGTGDLAVAVAEKLKHYSHFGIEVAGFLCPVKGQKEQKDIRMRVLGHFNDLERVVKKHEITDLFIALSLKEYNTIMSLIEVANNLLIDIRLVPDILQIASLKAGMEHIEGIPTINLGDIPLQGWGLFLKRCFDILVSVVGLILLSPFFLILALLIKIDSKGPLFYSQARVGLDGRHFNMIKFRTMIPDAEKETGAVWSPPDDQRVTRVGRVLRKLSIDEMPQLINVLKGDMSLVGPRPERPEFVEKFKNDIPKYMLRHRVRTGITGWAQVHGLRGNTPLDKRIEFDIYYIQNWTFKLDLEILWRTILKFKFIDRGQPSIDNP